MSFFSKVFRSRDKPPAVVDSTNGNSYRFYFGNSTSGKRVTEMSAMQITAVYACVRLIAESIAGLPLHLFRQENEGRKTKASDHPLYQLLYREPNPEMSSFSFRETLSTHLLLWGNAYAQIIRNGRGEVIALYPLMANRMKVDRDEKGKLYYEYQMMESDAKTMPDGMVRLRPEDVLHIPGLGFDGLVGYSPIAMAKNSIGLSMATEEYGSTFFKNSATPSGILSMPGTVKDPAKIRESWNQGFSGSSNAAKVAVLEEGATYTPISITPEESQFLETRKFQLDEICRIFNVPPNFIGDLEHATFSNIEQQSLNFVIYTLRPWLIRWEQAMERHLLNDEEKDGYFIRFNADALLRGDYQSRMNGYRTGLQSGFMSPNDVRDLEGLDRIPEEEGGNTYMVNGNMVKLRDVGAAYETGKEVNEK